MRIDKWLWVVRLFKTRSQATTACRAGRVSSAGNSLKPAHQVSVGQSIELREPPIQRSFKVLGLAPKRVSAALARELVTETTAREELDKLAQARREKFFSPFGRRPKGLGRPTKKERREIDSFFADD